MMIYATVSIFIIILILGIITYLLYNMFAYKKEKFNYPEKWEIDLINDNIYKYYVYYRDNPNGIPPFQSITNYIEKYGELSTRTKLFITCFIYMSVARINVWFANHRYKDIRPIDIVEHNFIIEYITTRLNQLKPDDQIIDSDVAIIMKFLRFSGGIPSDYPIVYKRIDMDYRSDMIMILDQLL